MNNILIYLKKAILRLPATLIGLLWFGVKACYHLLKLFLDIVVLGSIIGIICLISVYFQLKPLFEEARTVAFDKLAEMSDDSFKMTEDTKIYDTNNKLIGVVNAGHYKHVTIKEISPYIYEGYIAVEDRRFKTHGGFDLQSLMRAGVSLIRNSGDIVQGGSTITQQVIKNNILTQEQTYSRKITELLLAPTVEARYNKTEIMEFYCNTNFYGNRCYGVEAASEYYFNKNADELEPDEAAIIIGLSNNPTVFDPVKYPDNALNKRNRVLDTMYAEGVITYNQLITCKNKKIDVKCKKEEYSNENYMESYALYCATLELMKRNGFTFKYTFETKAIYDEYKEEFNRVYSEMSNEIRCGGYIIYTSLDKSIQKKLQEQVNKGLKSFTERQDNGKYALQGAAVCIDNSTQYVVAAVGGRGTADEYNRAFLSTRQPGSSIKPLAVYAPAFETGVYYPSKYVVDEKEENGPSNSGGHYYGSVTIREALARSLNTVAHRLMRDIEPDNALNYMGMMKFSSLTYVDNGNMSVALGGLTNGVRVCDIAKGYATIENNGEYSSRTCIRKIKNQDGKDIYKDKEASTVVYSPETAYLTKDCMRGVFEEDYGTGKSLRLKGQIAAGKTGTTNSGKDAWFCGFTGYYTTAVWVGYDIPRVTNIYGNSYPGRIWNGFMSEIHKGKQKMEFEIPSGVKLYNINSSGSKIDIHSGKVNRKNLGRNIDYFSIAGIKKAQVIKETEEAKESTYKVEKLVGAFEDYRIDSVMKAKGLEDKYKEVLDEIALIQDEYLQVAYKKRVAVKYFALQLEYKKWEPQIAIRRKNKALEKLNERKRQQEEAEKAREESEKTRYIEGFKLALDALNYVYTSDGEATDLALNNARKALNKCKKYDEFGKYNEQLEAKVDEIAKLPTIAEVERQQKVQEQVERKRALLNEFGSYMDTLKRMKARDGYKKILRKAMAILEQCTGYPEYDDMLADYELLEAQVKELPTQEELDYENTSLYEDEVDDAESGVTYDRRTDETGY